MTGGFDLARKVNRNLAAAAQELGIAMGVGSQRVAIEEPAAVDSFQVRDVAPDILLLGNLGAVQLNYGYSIDQCRRAVEMIGADALILHLNVLQEALQPEGNRNFKGLTEKIATVCRELKVPVVVKEVGNGISVEVAKRLHGAGVAAIDIAGKGGTAWSAVEAQRATQQGKPYRYEHLPTGESPPRKRWLACAQRCRRSSWSLRAAFAADWTSPRAIALGADLAAFGQPLLGRGFGVVPEVVKFIDGIIHELKVTMLCVGAANLQSLRQTPLVR